MTKKASRKRAGEIRSDFRLFGLDSVKSRNDFQKMSNLVSAKSKSDKSLSTYTTGGTNKKESRDAKLESDT